MITTTDIANILYAECKSLGIPAYQEGNVARGELDGERVVIHSKQQTSETKWLKSFAEVNIFVPNNGDDNARLIRLNELERLARKELNRAGQYDGTAYKFKVDSTQILESKEFRAWYVNVRILFQAINVLE